MLEANGHVYIDTEGANACYVGPRFGVPATYQSLKKLCLHTKETLALL
jgi:hypothetical protein